jgi:hypothetical protein
VTQGGWAILSSKDWLSQATLSATASISEPASVPAVAAVNSVAELSIGGKNRRLVDAQAGGQASRLWDGGGDAGGVGGGEQGVGFSGRSFAGGLLLEGYAPPGGGNGIGVLVWDELGVGRLLWLPTGGDYRQVGILHLTPSTSLVSISQSFERGVFSVFRRDSQAGGMLSIDIVPLPVERTWEGVGSDRLGMDEGGGAGVGELESGDGRTVVGAGEMWQPSQVDCAEMKMAEGRGWREHEGDGTGVRVEEVTVSMIACPGSAAPHMHFEVSIAVLYLCTRGGKVH